jgi:hypothetical protein
MAKNSEMIKGESANWEVMFFRLIDRTVRYLKPGAHIHRYELVSTEGMDFVRKELGRIGYVVNKTPENTLQTTIGTLVKKKFILTNGSGTYALTNKGYERLIEIQENYDRKKENPIGPTGFALKALENLDEKIREVLLRTFRAQNGKNPRN